MARVILYQPLNMNEFPFAVGETSYPILTSTHIRELTDYSEANYFGVGLTVNGAGDVTSGTLTGADYREDGVLQFSVTEMNHNAALVWDYIVANDTYGLLSYVLNGADTITGSDGDDYIYSYGGNDVVSGGDGNDVIVGGVGADTLKSGRGGDTVFGESGDDFLKGGKGADYLGGGAGGDMLKGGADADFLDGEGSADELTGGAGNDLLLGGGGKDLVEGKDGDDILDGEKGSDTLVGGDGMDIFWFGTALGAKNVDEIADFTGAGPASGDKISLDADLFTPLSVGALDAGNFVSGVAVAAADADDFILYDTGSGALYFDADGNGEGAAIQFAIVTGSPDALDQMDIDIV